MKSQGGLSTRRSWAARYDASIVAGAVDSASAAKAASNLSSFHCSKLKPLGEKLADEKYRAMMPTSDDGDEKLRAIAPCSIGLSGVARTALTKTVQSTASNSTLTPQACFRLSCRYSFIGSGDIWPEPEVEIITLNDSGICDV